MDSDFEMIAGADINLKINEEITGSMVLLMVVEFMMIIIIKLLAS